MAPSFFVASAQKVGFDFQPGRNRRFGLFLASVGLRSLFFKAVGLWKR